MSDGAAATILCSPEGLAKLEAAGARIPRPLVKISGIGRGTDAMRMSDRPHQSFDDFCRHNLLPNEDTPATHAYYRELWDPREPMWQTMCWQILLPKRLPSWMPPSSGPARRWPAFWSTAPERR